MEDKPRNNSQLISRKTGAIMKISIDIARYALAVRTSEAFIYQICGVMVFARMDDGTTLFPAAGAYVFPARKDGAAVMVFTGNRPLADSRFVATAAISRKLFNESLPVRTVIACP